MITSITIPLKLVSEANCSEHWTKKAKRHKTQKMIVKSYCNSYLPIPVNLPVCITLTRCAPRPYDSDNLQSSFKYIRDFLAEWATGIEGAGKADSDPRITWIYSQKKTKDKEHYITISIEQNPLS